jgi:hypothetical protein
VDWFFWFVSCSRLLTLPCHSIWTERNQLSSSIPSELGALTALTRLAFCTWLDLSCSYEFHACSHFLAILFGQMIISSRAPFRANSEDWRRYISCGSVRGLVCLFLLWMSRLLTFPCHYMCAGVNKFSGSLPSELGELTSVTWLDFRTWIVLSCSYECHACSHFLAILFGQMIINSQVPFRANSEN